MASCDWIEEFCDAVGSDDRRQYIFDNYWDEYRYDFDDERGGDDAIERFKEAALAGEDDVFLDWLVDDILTEEYVLRDYNETPESFVLSAIYGTNSFSYDEYDMSVIKRIVDAYCDYYEADVSNLISFMYDLGWSNFDEESVNLLTYWNDEIWDISGDDIYVQLVDEEVPASEYLDRF